MTTMDDRVQQAADALIRATSGDIANWELAQLTYENTKAHGRPPVEDERMAIADWCERIRERSGRKFSRATGVLYRSIWEKYKNYERSSFPEWNDAYYDVRGKSREAMDNEFVTAKARHVIDGLEHVKPEVKRALADRIMSEPDIAERQENKFVEQAGKNPALAWKVQRSYEEQHPKTEPKPKTWTREMTLFAVGSTLYTDVQRRGKDLRALESYLSSNAVSLNDTVRAMAEETIGDISATKKLLSEYEEMLWTALGVDRDETARRLLESVGDR